MNAPRETVRPCTCHPDDNPPVPCPQKYALTDCRMAALERTVAELLEYARHYARCPRTADLWDANASQIVRAEERKCECGLDALLARLEGK